MAEARPAGEERAASPCSAGPYATRSPERTSLGLRRCPPGIASTGFWASLIVTLSPLPLWTIAPWKSPSASGDARIARVSVPPADSPTTEISAEVSDHLRAIGYVAWDEDADEDLAGVIWHSREAAAPGLNLFTNDSDTVRLMDAEGRSIREWRLRGYKHCEQVDLIAERAVADPSTGTNPRLLDVEGAKNIFLAALSGSLEA